jgi:UDP-N-acetylglucosamine:LPS N-acetylglucosamine transferase
MRLLLVCSSGGHLTQLHVLEDWWRRHDAHWVTFDTEHARTLLEDQPTTWAFHPTTRNIPNLLRNFGVAFRTIRRERPDVVISTGAGVALPFFLLARLFGVRTAYLEVYDRITLPTLTGRLCAPLTDVFMLQWPEQQSNYPQGVVVGQVF